MHHYTKSVSIVCLWIAVWQQAWPCEPIDARFMPHGEVVTVNNEMMRGPAGSLEHLVGALFARRQGDPVTVAVHISIDPSKQDMTVTNELSTLAQGRTVMHKIRCNGTEWVYTDKGSGSAEGVYRARDVRVSFRQMDNGDLIIRYEKHLVSGLIFRTKEFFSSVSTFKRIATNAEQQTLDRAAP